MVNKTMIMGFAVVTGLFFLMIPVNAAGAISTINAGNTVFIGEQGLDITAAMDGDSILGWWASGAAIASSSPDYTLEVSNPASFSISSTEFATHTGNWYHLSSLSHANGTAFSVADPQINLRIEDTTSGNDVTNKWVPTDNELQFRIETNLVPIIQRGVSNVPITIKVQSPDGAILSSLVSKNGGTTTIVDYPVTTSPKYTGPIWGTSNRATYLPGTYYVWAECNVNSMNDYYGQIGKTISGKVNVLNQDQNPLISNKGYVTNPTTSVTTVTSRSFTTVTITMTPSITSPTTLSTTSPTLVVTTSPDTIPAIKTQQESPSPSAKTPGFGGVIVILSVIIGFAFFLKEQ